jgi:thioredoxin 1
MVAKENVRELSSREFSDFIKDKGLVIIDFYAEWCMPCVMMAPIFESVAENIGNKAKFAKVNVEESGKIAQEHNASSIPTLIFFKDGKEVDRIVGAVDEEELETKIKEYL